MAAEATRGATVPRQEQVARGFEGRAASDGGPGEEGGGERKQQALIANASWSPQPPTRRWLNGSESRQGLAASRYLARMLVCKWFDVAWVAEGDRNLVPKAKWGDRTR